MKINGREFSVVADKARQLAEKTQKSLVEINTSIIYLESEGFASAFGD